jgi:cell shape-determining protein MreC
LGEYEEVKEPTSAEFQQLLNENEALRAEIAEFRRALQTEIALAEDLSKDNQRLHAELRFFNERA